MARELSRRGWHVMPTVRNARGADLYAASADERTVLPIQSKALSKQVPVPLGGSLDTLRSPWWIVTVHANTATPVCYVMTLDEVKAGAHRGVTRPGRSPTGFSRRHTPCRHIWRRGIGWVILQPYSRSTHYEAPLTTNFATPVPSQAPRTEPEQPSPPTWREVAPIVAALVATLEAIEIGPKAGPAMRVHRSALRRQGEAAAALGGPEVMDAVLHQVAEVDQARSERRLAFVREAWVGLPGLRA